jgi:hypothetical protein
MCLYCGNAINSFAKNAEFHADVSTVEKKEEKKLNLLD